MNITENATVVDAAPVAPYIPDATALRTNGSQCSWDGEKQACELSAFFILSNISMPQGDAVAAAVIKAVAANALCNLIEVETDCTANGTAGNCNWVGTSTPSCRLADGEIARAAKQAAACPGSVAADALPCGEAKNASDCATAPANCTWLPDYSPPPPPEPVAPPSSLGAAGGLRFPGTGEPRPDRRTRPGFEDPMEDETTTSPSPEGAAGDFDFTPPIGDDEEPTFVDSSPSPTAAPGEELPMRVSRPGVGPAGPLYSPLPDAAPSAEEPAAPEDAAPGDAAPEDAPETGEGEDEELPGGVPVLPSRTQPRASPLPGGAPAPGERAVGPEASPLPGVATTLPPASPAPGDDAPAVGVEPGVEPGPDDTPLPATSPGPISPAVKPSPPLRKLLRSLQQVIEAVNTTTPAPDGTPLPVEDPPAPGADADASPEPGARLNSSLADLFPRFGALVRPLAPSDAPEAAGGDADDKEGEQLCVATSLADSASSREAAAAQMGAFDAEFWGNCSNLEALTRIVEAKSAADVFAALSAMGADTGIPALPSKASLQCGAAPTAAECAVSGSPVPLDPAAYAAIKGGDFTALAALKPEVASRRSRRVDSAAGGRGAAAALVAAAAAVAVLLV